MKIGFWGLLFIVLLVLKLTEVAQISWLVVFLPVILATVLLVLALCIVAKPPK